jgi:hypothetical protein
MQYNRGSGSSSASSEEDENTSQSSTSSITPLNPNVSLADDVDAIALLKQIFPEDSPQALRQLHHDHLYRRIKEHNQGQQSSAQQLPASNLGRRIWNVLRETAPQAATDWKPVQLDESFLRLPTSVAVRRSSSEGGGRYEFIANLHDQVLQEYLMVQQSRNSTLEEPSLMEGEAAHTTLWFPMRQQQVYLFTVVIHRHAQIGLGLTLTVRQPPQSTRTIVQVHGLLSHPENPCLATQIRPLDALLGVNGSIFYAPTIKTVVETIRKSPEPLVLHLLRVSEPLLPPVERYHSLLDIAFNPDEEEFFENPTLHATDDHSIATTSTMTTTASSSWMTPHRTSRTGSSSSAPTKPVIHKIHPLARALCRKGLIRGLADEERVTQRLYQFHCRAQQWDAHQSLLIDYRTGTLVPRDSALEDHRYPSTMNLTSPPSTPPLDHMEATGILPTLPFRSFPGEVVSHQVSLLPLYYIRKALCARIVNTFQEQVGKDSRMAFTIWVYDVETTREWYAPIRYAQDFEDLYHACKDLVGQIDLDFPFHQSTWFRRRRQHTQEDTDRLEHFLRLLSGWIYTCEKLTPTVAEAAVHVQSFLGVESAMAEATRQVATPSVRQELKMALQRYTYRVTLLTVVTLLIDDFCDATRKCGPELPEIETMQMHSTLQARARSDLHKIQSFLDSLVDLILEGCEDDLRAISRHEYYADLVLDDEDSWERLVREAVREQVEIEVYVPLRSVVSRLLVHGWRHEDMQVQFKLKELRKRKPSRENIPWPSVAKILREGVGMSTLPCVKLRAIVEASRELARHYESADEFLPLFIYCVIQADLERPCALCVLLQTLCDKMNRIGEIGYFLASFEAAIAHITDLDLTEREEDVDEKYISFSSEPMTEVSLD